MMDVKSSGVKGDGKTDDSLAIQKAILKSDGLLFFPRGDYLEANGIELEYTMNALLSDLFIHLI
jgi:polygalacturonase